MSLLAAAQSRPHVEVNCVSCLCACPCVPAALLSISEQCPALQNLNISGVKKVSDVGIRYLSQGCVRLQNLDLTGVFLVTDGKARDFGLEGLQVRHTAFVQCSSPGPTSPCHRALAAPCSNTIAWCRGWCHTRTYYAVFCVVGTEHP